MSSSGKTEEKKQKINFVCCSKRKERGAVRKEREGEGEEVREEDKERQWECERKIERGKDKGRRRARDRGK